jgi:hypothetical protein
MRPPRFRFTIKRMIVAVLLAGTAFGVTNLLAKSARSRSLAGHHARLEADCIKKS